MGRVAPCAHKGKAMGAWLALSLASTRVE